MAALMFVLIDGIKGESSDALHPGWIDAISFTHSIAVPIITSGGGGSAAGRPQEIFSFTKQTDSVSPLLYVMCSTGKHIKTVTIDFMQVTNDVQSKYMSVQMNDVILSGITTSGDVQGPATDSLSLNYGSIVWTPVQRAADATLLRVDAPVLMKDLRPLQQ